MKFDKKLCLGIEWKDFLNLFSDIDRYSVSYFKKVLWSSEPEANDPLYDPQSEIYDASSPLCDPDNRNHWIKFVTRFSIVNDKKVPNPVENKDFYKSWLLLIQNDLLKYDGGMFEDFRDIVFPPGQDPLKFSVGPELTANDLKIIESMDGVLKEVFGYPGFFLLFSGIMTFRENFKTDSTFMDFKIDFILFTNFEFKKNLIKFGIKSLYSNLEENQIYSIKSRANSINRINVFSSILISGFSHFEKGKTITKNLKVIPSSEQGFLKDYFNVYEPKNKLDYTKAKQSFLRNDYQNYKDGLNLKEGSTFGRKKILSKVAEKIDVILEHIFVKTDDYKKYAQFKDDPVFWHYWTAKIAKSYVRRFLDRPAGKSKKLDVERDLIRKVRDALMKHEDCVLKIQASSDGSGRLSAYGSNELIKQGFTVVIPYHELYEMVKDDDILTTIAFYFEPKKQQQGKVSPPGYFLDVNLELTEELKAKFFEAYDLLLKMFKEGDNNKFILRFYTESGGGISAGNKIRDSYEKLGFEGYRYKFDRRQPAELHRAIQSILFYTFALPDVVVVVKTEWLKDEDFDYKPTFLLMDIFGILHPDHASRTTFSNKLSLHTAWTESGQGAKLSPEKYRDYTKKFGGLFINERGVSEIFKGIFSDDDVRFFLGFHNAGTTTWSADTNKAMLIYMWKVTFTKFLEEKKKKYRAPIIEDLMGGDLTS